MQAPLIRLAATIAGGDAPIVLFGLDTAPALDAKVASPLRAVSEAGAGHLVGLLGRAEPLTDDLLAEATAVDAETLAAAVAVLIPGRGGGWTTTGAAVLAADLVERLRAVIVTARPSGLAQSPHDLDAILRRATATPLFTGWLPPDDALAPGCPVAILQPLPDAPEAPVTALLRVQDDEATLEHTLRWLAGEGIATIVVDGGSTDGSTNLAEAWLGRGVVSVARAETEAETTFLEEAAAAEVGSGWLLRLAASERLQGPWPETGLRRTLGRFTAAGWDSVGATTLDFGSGPGDDGRLDFGRSPRPWRFALPDPAARPVAWRVGGDPARRAPYNLLVRRYPVGPADHTRGWNTLDLPPPDWEPWDETALGRFLVERLTGHGIFRRRYPTPPEGCWFAEERLLDWTPSLLNAVLSRLPSPDPLAAEPGIVRIQWNTLDGSPGAVFIGSKREGGELIAHGVAGMVTVDHIEPNAPYIVRLYADASRSRLLGELQFGVRMEPGA